jgi:hypothetical protein
MNHHDITTVVCITVETICVLGLAVLAEWYRRGLETYRKSNKILWDALCTIAQDPEEKAITHHYEASEAIIKALDIETEFFCPKKKNQVRQTTYD